jgi:hypothetical protein
LTTAKETHRIDVDWSDDSIPQIERIAALLHDDYDKTRPSSEQVAPFDKALGSYIGDSFTITAGQPLSWMQHKPAVCIGRGCLATHGRGHTFGK